MPSSLGVSFGAVLFVGLVVLGASLAASLIRPAETRAAQVGGLLPLATLAPLLALSLAAWRTIQAFDSSATAPGAGAQLVEELRNQWLLVRVGFGSAAACALAGLGLAWSRVRRPASGLVPLDPLRGGALALTAGLALATLLGLTAELRVGLGLVEASLVETKPGSPSDDASRAYMEAVGIGRQPAVRSLVERLSRSLMISLVGAALGLFTMAGLAGGGLFLAWRVQPGAAFGWMATLLWLALLVPAALAAIGFGTPPRF